MSEKAQHAADNTPEKMLARGGRLIRNASNQVVRLTLGEREYLEWLVAERKERGTSGH